MYINIFFKVAPKLGQRLCTIIVQGIWSNFTKNILFIIFSDTRTYPYMVCKKV